MIVELFVSIAEVVAREPLHHAVLLVGVFNEFFVDVITGCDDSIAVVNSQLAKLNEIELFLIRLQQFVRSFPELDATLEVFSQFTLGLVVEERCDDLGIGKGRLIVIGSLYIKRNDGAHPPLTMYDVGSPAKFLHGLKHASGKENGTFAIVGIFLA